MRRFDIGTHLFLGKLKMIMKIFKKSVAWGREIYSCASRYLFMHICFSWGRLKHLLCEKLYILGLLSIQEAQRLVNNVIRKLKLGSDCVLMIKVNERSENKLRRNTSWERVCISDVTHWGHWSSPQNRNLMISNYLSTDSLSFLVNF